MIFSACICICVRQKRVKPTLIEANYLLSVSNDSDAHPPHPRPAQFEMHLKICAQKSPQFRQFSYLLRYLCITQRVIKVDNAQRWQLKLTTVSYYVVATGESTFRGSNTPVPPQTLMAPSGFHQDKMPSDLRSHLIHFRLFAQIPSSFTIWLPVHWDGIIKGKIDVIKGSCAVYTVAHVVAFVVKLTVAHSTRH